ncbi:MAG: efflux RND transporter permease subunit [Candidatus Izimaplasma sp.]|nr:efflux RND transporter permease subunit [Candidatus Izimaplasma bacterium]
MKNLASYSVNKAITVFMAVIIVIVFGVVSYTNLTTDLLPSLNIPYSVVVTYYPGKSPEEIEQLVTRPIEESLATTTNIKEMNSTSSENVSMVILEFNSDTSMDSAILEMRENLDMIASQLPDDVMDPMIIKLNPDLMPVMQLSVSQEGLSEQALTTYVVEDVIPRIERIKGVASVSISGAYESDVHVVLDQAAIDTINTQLQSMYDAMPSPPDNPILLDKPLIENILKAQNVSFPVGYVNIEGVDYLVRVGDDFQTVDALNQLEIFNFPGVALLGIEPVVVTLDDIADVTYVNANTNAYSKVNGNNAISITIQKSSNIATTEVTNEINTLLQDIETESDTEITVLLDQGKYIEQATGSVSNNLYIGAVLAIIVLLIFLRSARATFIVGVSIPISLLFAIVLIYFSNITLNIVSLGGLALGIGMLVDNSIVVMENIFRLKNEGKANKEAAIQGAKQVAGAITASTITTISVFIPVLFIEGFIKEIFIEMAYTIAYSLFASLIIALTLVPAISSKILKDKKQTHKYPRYKMIYERIYKFAFGYKVWILGLVMILFGGFLYVSQAKGFEYFPPSDEGEIVVSVSNPVDTPLSFTEFTDILEALNNDLLAINDVETVGITLGSMQGMFFGLQNENNATVNVLLGDDRNNTTSKNEIIIKELLATDYQMVNVSVSGSQQQTEMLTGSGLQVVLLGYDLDILQQEAKAIASLISGIEGVEDVNDGIGILSDEIHVTVDKSIAIQNGLTTAQVLGIIAEELQTETVITTINEQGSLYDVYVIDDTSNINTASRSIEEIEEIVVGANMMTGNPITVGDVASVELEKGLNNIRHIDGNRSLTVDVDFEEDVNVTDISNTIKKEVENYTLPDGFSYTISGENEETMEAFETLGLALLLAIVLIYMIMASQFQSLKYPFIIMFTIPLAFTGGFAILYFANMPLSVVALIGFVILVGVVVNNGIVLVDYTNQLIDEGYEVEDALLEAGKTRLRPIVMTALTTILALLTMALGFGEGAEMMQPMAVTTIGGLLYATMLTLLIVPMMYYLLYRYAKRVFLIMLILLFVGGIIAAQILLGQFLYIILGSVFVIICLALLVYDFMKYGATYE